MIDVTKALLDQLRKFVTAAQGPGELPWARIEGEVGDWFLENGDALLTALAQPSAGAEASIPIGFVDSHDLQRMTLGATSKTTMHFDRRENDAPLYATPQPDARDADAAFAELRNIVYAKRFDREYFPSDREFSDWAQSRALAAIAGTQPSGATP